MLDLTRRAFVGTVASVAVAGAFGETVKALGGNGELVRPPLALDEADLSARCLRCYRCMEACHTHAITTASLEDGLLALHTPKMDFHVGSCDFCNRCVEMCPTGCFNIADPLRPETGRMGVAVVQPDRCVAFVDGCQRCIDSCPYGAISADASGYPEVDVGKCNGCGVCENICPALSCRTFNGGRRRGIMVVNDHHFNRSGGLDQVEGDLNA